MEERNKNFKELWQEILHCASPGHVTKTESIAHVYLKFSYHLKHCLTVQNQFNLPISLI